MSLFDRIFKQNQKMKNAQGGSILKLINGYQPVFRTWRGEIYESELVRAAIDARARHIGKLRIEVLGDANPRLAKLLKLGPNEWQTWYQFLYRTSTILDVKNSVVIVPVKDSWLRTTGFYSVLPDRCALVEYGGEVWIRYKSDNGEVAAERFVECAILTKHQFRNDFFGEDNGALDSTMELIDMNRQGISKAVKNSMSYRFMAQMANFSTDDDLVNERKRFTAENLRSDAEAEGVLIFPNTYSNIQQIKVDPYTPDPKQMEIIENNIFDFFGVNREVLQNMAYGDAWSAFYEGAVEPFGIQFSEALTKAVFTLTERENGAEIVASASRLQYMSNKDKLNVSAQMADRGLLTINEIRDIWNLPHLPDGDRTIMRGEYKSSDEKEDNDGQDRNEEDS